MEEYEVLKKVGEGSFGQVYKAKKRSDGEIVAFKVIQKHSRSLKELKSLRQECKIQRRLHHPNIIQMLDSFETENEIVVVTEYADKELYKILAEAGRLSEQRAQVIACDLVSALYYLHSNKVLHRDLKPQNVVLKSNGVAKLCDFGFARSVTTGTRVILSIKGTPLYMAPEIFEECPYDHNADLWSLGCIIYELVVGSPPFKTNSILHLVRLIRFEAIKWPNFVSQTCKSFLQGLLQKDSSRRLTWPALLKHDFVKDRVIRIDKVSETKGKREKPHQLQDLVVHSFSKPFDEQFNDDTSSVRQQTVLSKHETKVIQCDGNQIHLQGNNSVNNSISFNYKLPDLYPKATIEEPIENEEWIAFLQRTMKEIINGEVDSLLQPHCVSVFVSPLKSLTADRRVIQCVVCLLSLPFVVSTTKDFLDKIEQVYLDVRVVTHLVNAIKVLTSNPFKLFETDRKPDNTSIRLSSMLSTDELETLEYTMLVLCRLVYIGERFVVEFCHAIYVTNGVAFLQQLLILEKRKARIVADLIAVLNSILRFQSKEVYLVEKVILFSHLPGSPIEQFRKLLTHQEGTLKARTCHLIGLLGKLSSRTLEQIGYGCLKNLIEGLTTDDDQTVKRAADHAINELNQSMCQNQQNSII